MGLLHEAAEETAEPEALAEGGVPPLSDSELLMLRRFIQDLGIIRATCPMALRALSTRK